jgi:hypothetical protein
MECGTERRNSSSYTLTIQQQPGASLRSTSLLTSNRAEAIEPSNKSVTHAKNMIVKEGQQKKKKASSATANQGENPTTEKLLKRDTSMGKGTGQPIIAKKGKKKNKTAKHLIS